MRILVVDDMITIRHVLIHMLRDIGFDTIDEACDGLQALQMLEKKRYDLIISDYNMPKVDGLQLVERLRSSIHYRNIPVMIVSCVDSKEKVQKFIKHNISGFIVKPFSTNTLKKQMNRIQESLIPQKEIRLG